MEDRLDQESHVAVIDAGDGVCSNRSPGDGLPVIATRRPVNLIIGSYGIPRSPGSTQYVAVTTYASV